MKKMKVLIVGSLPRDKESEKRSPTEKEQYRQACREIGKKLADSGWPIGIGTFNSDTADALIIEGAAKSDRKIKVTVYLRREEYGLFAAEIQRRKSQAKNIDFKPEPIKGTWKTGRIEQMKKSDIVFLIGGDDKTAPAFIVAHLLKKPCLPIPGFGGASEEQWDEFSARIEHLRLNPEKQLGQRVKPWTSDDSASPVLRTKPWRQRSKPWRSDDSVSAVLRTKPWRSEDSASAVLKFARQYVDSQPYLEKDRFLVPSLLIAASAALGWTILFFGQSSARGWAIFGILATTSVMGTALYWLASPSRKRNDTRGNALSVFCPVARAACSRSHARRAFRFALVSMLRGQCPWLSVRSDDWEPAGTDI